MGIPRASAFFKELEQRISEVTAVLAKQTSTCGYPFYSSMDIRDADWKVCSVDVNIFPAGFNQLDAEDLKRAALRTLQFFSAKLGTPPPWEICLVPEAHTNNAGYLENLAGLIGILQDAGARVRLAWSGPPLPKAWTVKTASGKELTYLPAAEALDGARAVILNHDLSGGIPAFLKDSQLPTFPSPRLGWYRRRKSQHFAIVQSLLNKIQTELPWFDPWYFHVAQRTVEGVDFESDEGRSRVAHEAEILLAQLKLDYAAREITESPRLFVKNDAGTYGMGVLAVRTPSEILDLGRSEKNKMRKGKESVPISNIIIQEAIPTAMVYSNSTGTVAGEPVLYMVDGLPVGGFVRIHEKLGPDAAWANLNQPGGSLEAMSRFAGDCSSRRPFPKMRGLCPREEVEGKSVYYFLCKLHATAASLEECIG
jgi:glutamate--cysteine ligase